MGTMAVCRASLLHWMVLSMAVMLAQAEDPYLFYEWKVTYGTQSPLGVPEQVILINDQFPGPALNTTTNNNVVINVFNQLDEPLLFHWAGMKQFKNSWQEGTPGTMCPIQPGTNYTYHFQVKDQVGSYYYYPSMNLQQASGGYGSLKIHHRVGILNLSYAIPEAEFEVMVGDWFSQGHAALRKILDGGKSLGKPDGLLINGKKGQVGDDKEPPMFVMKPGKTYLYRICNAGMRNSVNWRMQNHKMKLADYMGSRPVQNTYESLDIHLGQCLSVLVTADQEPKDYYMVVSSRFTKYHLEAVAKFGYEGGKGPASSELPKAPDGWAWSLNQFRSIRWNLTASAARPNPQGSYRYGSINITRTIRLANTAGTVDGKLRYAINGRSHVDTETPLKLAEYYGIADKVFKYDTIPTEPPANLDSGRSNIELGPIVMNTTWKEFLEIIIENHEVGIQYWQMSGYAFFPVAIEVGQWSPEKRDLYNMLDAPSVYAVQVYPKSWVAMLITLDNAGMWNLRSANVEKSYLGQQMYFSVLSPEKSNRDEYNMLNTTMVCGLVKDLPMPPDQYH